ncbi:hypothetical protein VD0002_g7289 [Verticillium dahliae]|uniref:Uncharacterized protein n=2 Tax=Verticillium dahliae TaxID=27337 RepID=G2XD16_VERDV|nr:uncharacterized protein VDAG_08048 [Verticillium dahliae VdLs.17]KAF3345642.1 Calcium-binding protein NCS-1 [Verticillium dahliae VDG2]KAH6706742.1 hypothetical protein EV126DRAFT_409973 [Verticillium dahliae]EGY16884.1 hypothetical protein VDAG_08048 [Verticillium dahliae VdLs.17]PNH27824.1 hypothetical protein BJF96_g8797 [Verticillium dahliae]PNH48912.1 hypothetical protein VD0003_g8215 [Verticillium dahliae]
MTDKIAQTAAQHMTATGVEERAQQIGTKQISAARLRSPGCGISSFAGTVGVALERQNGQVSERQQRAADDGLEGTRDEPHVIIGRDEEAMASSLEESADWVVRQASAGLPAGRYFD